jgi:hypothetical protein
MSTIAEYQTAASASTPNPDQALTATRRGLTSSHWYYFTALAAVPFVFVTLPNFNKDLQDIARLERLAPKIERAQTLSPEFIAIVDRLMARQSMRVGSNDPSQEMRRKAVIERISGAMKATDATTVTRASDLPPQE